MWANDGQEPTQIAWDYLSQQKKGPSASIIRYKFEDGFTEFKNRVKKQFTQDKEERAKDQEEKLELISQGINDGRLPRELFEGSMDEDELIVRYSKYLIIKELGLSPKLDALKEMCTTGINGRGFISSITKQAFAEYSSAVSFRVGDIELAANSLGVFEYIWPMDEYKKNLRIIDDPEFIRRRSKKNLRRHKVQV
jgi:hypothetical protein